MERERREQELRDYFDRIEDCDPAIQRLAKSDPQTLRQIFRDGWDVAADAILALPTVTAGEDDYEYGWEADPLARAARNPRGPKYQFDDHLYTPEEIAEFPRGRRIRRRRAGEWEVVDATPTPTAPQVPNEGGVTVEHVHDATCVLDCPVKQAARDANTPAAGLPVEGER